MLDEDKTRDDAYAADSFPVMRGHATVACPDCTVLGQQNVARLNKTLAITSSIMSVKDMAEDSLLLR